MLQQLEKDLFTIPDSLRVIILKANGPVFSAGHDLREMVSRGSLSDHFFPFCDFLVIFFSDVAMCDLVHIV